MATASPHSSVTSATASEWNAPRRHNALKCSNGSAHSRQRCNDLQAVAPKRDVSTVSAEPQRGQVSRGCHGAHGDRDRRPRHPPRRRTRRGDPGGGELAAARGTDPVGASTPASAGHGRRRRRSPPGAGRRRRRRASRPSPGTRCTSASARRRRCPRSTTTSPSTPRSSSVSWGSSGSVTAAATSRGSAIAVTTSPPGRPGRAPAARRARPRASALCTPSRPTVGAGAGRGRCGERGGAEHRRRSTAANSAPNGAGSTATPASARRRSTVADREQLADKRPDGVEGTQRCGRCDSSVPSPRRIAHCAA